MKLITCLSLFVTLTIAAKVGEHCDYQPCIEFSGDGCDSSSRQADCDIGLQCAGDDTCKYGLDSPCTQSSECAEGFCYQNKCSFQEGPGSPCNSHSECHGGFVCNNKICGARTYFNVGDPCKDSGQCKFGCVNGKCDGESKYQCSNNSQCIRYKARGGVKFKGECIGGTCY